MCEQPRIIEHGVKWVLNGLIPKCPDCDYELKHYMSNFGLDSVKNNEVGISDLALKHTGSIIGRKAIWRCPECYCLFEYSRKFEEGTE
jgi:hypothetical protein